MTQTPDERRATAAEKALPEFTAGGTLYEENYFRCGFVLGCEHEAAFAEAKITRLKEALSVAREALCSIAVPGALQTRDDWQMAFARKALASIDRIEGGSK